MQNKTHAEKLKTSSDCGNLVLFATERGFLGALECFETHGFKLKSTQIQQTLVFSILDKDTLQWVLNHGGDKILNQRLNDL